MAEDASMTDKYDNLLANIAQRVGGIGDLLDVFFGFLMRRTDFFVEASNVCEDLVVTHLKKYQALALQKKRKEEEVKNQEKKKIAQEEEKKKSGKQPSEEEVEYKKYQEYLRSQPAVQEVDDEEEEKAILAAEEKAKLAVESMENRGKKEEAVDGEDEKDEEEESERPPEGNGGKTDRYWWTQTLSCVEVFISVPEGVKARECNVTITGTHLKLGLKGMPLIIDQPFHAKIKQDVSFWTLEDNKVIHLTLEKTDGMRWWSCVLVGDNEIDTKKIVPENSKLSDLDPETRSTVEKMMFDQRQKASGLPSSDQLKQAEMLEKFKKAHPEMDFSNAKINWGGNSSAGFGGGFGF